jgi:hypothetical protein
MTRWIEELQPRARGRSDSKICLNALGVLGPAGLLFIRGPGHLLHPELWAEDGVVWLHGAYTEGVHCLTIPRAGYLQTLSNLGGLIAAALPLTDAPLLFALIAFIIQLTPVILLLSPRGAVLLPSWSARQLLVLYDIGMPNSSEVFVNLTNAMWHLAIAVFLLVVLPKPRSIAGLAADITVLVLGGLSGPLVLFIAPIAWWQVAAFRRRGDGGKRVLYAAVLTLCAVVQGVLVVAHSGENRIGHLGASFNRFVHILADQIVLGGVIGARYVDILLTQHFWLQSWPAALCCAFASSAGAGRFCPWAGGVSPVRRAGGAADGECAEIADGVGIGDAMDADAVSDDWRSLLYHSDAGVVYDVAGAGRWQVAFWAALGGARGDPVLRSRLGDGLALCSVCSYRLS